MRVVRGAIPGNYAVIIDHEYPAGEACTMPPPPGEVGVLMPAPEGWDYAAPNTRFAFYPAPDAVLVPSDLRTLANLCEAVDPMNCAGV